MSYKTTKQEQIESINEDINKHIKNSTKQNYKILELENKIEELEKELKQSAVNEQNPNYEAENIKNFGFSIEACESESPIILKVFVQDEISINGYRSKIGYAIVRLHRTNGEVELVTWRIINHAEERKINFNQLRFFAEHGHYSGSFEPTVEEYKKRLREAENDFSKRVKGMISPWFDSYIKSTDECHIKSTRKEIIK